MRSSSPLGLGGTGRAEALRFRVGGRGTFVRSFLAMAFSLPCCFLTREILPPLDRYVDVGGLDLDGVDDPPLLLASNDRGARPDERIVDVTLVVVNSPLHTLDRLLGRVAGFRFPGVVDPVATDSSTCFLISTLLLRELSRNQVSKKTLGRRIPVLRVDVVAKPTVAYLIDEPLIIPRRPFNDHRGHVRYMGVQKITERCGRENPVRIYDQPGMA